MHDYSDEASLVAHLLQCLRLESAPWGPLDVSREFFYQRGRTDVVAVTRDGDILAFEAKLRKWREALHQAYRNTCFAHRSYVLVPHEVAVAAVRFATEFERRRGGLCYLRDNALVVLRESAFTAPLQPWLSARAAASTRLVAC
jgi:hypothetical protein